MSQPSTIVHVAGTGLAGSGYPNAAGTLRMLRGMPGVQVSDRAPWLPPGTALWRQARGLGALPFLVRLGLRNALEAWRVLREADRRKDWVYAPYPSIFLLWWLSWLPRPLRPRVVADAYVSLWDAAFRDRGVSSENGLVSRLVLRFEARALRAARFVLVDTEANRDWYLERFRLRPGQVHAVPLAIDDPGVGGQPTADGPLRVLFLGTLVPLHGVAVIADAIRRLGAESAPVEFVLAGDGQDRAALEELMARPPGVPLRWLRDWQGPEDVARLVREADVCLGVFGGGGKASRVLPFKVYLALAAGRAVVTQDQWSLPEGVPPPPVRGVAADGVSLAKALLELATDRDALAALSARARPYFDRHLGPDGLSSAWQALLGDPAGPPVTAR